MCTNHQANLAWSSVCEQQQKLIVEDTAWCASWLSIRHELMLPMLGYWDEPTWLEKAFTSALPVSVCVSVCVVVIFGIYASETFPQMSKVAVDRLVLETEGAVSRGLAELFRQVSDHWFLSTVCVIYFVISVHHTLCTCQGLMQHANIVYFDAIIYRVCQ